MSTMMKTKTPGLRVGFALEYSLGHSTHAQNLKRVLESHPEIAPSFADIRFDDRSGVWARLPGVRSNWSVRASLCAYLALRPHARHLQAALFHTQVTSLFSGGLMRRVPSVVSLDATPLQYDTLGAYYGHRPGANARIEALKKEMNVRAFRAARHLVTWSQWTKDSLIDDYGMPAEKISVIPPGIDTRQWGFPRPIARPQDTVHLLFVGGDFMRKGGDVLMEAFKNLPSTLNVTLHLVTNELDPDAVPSNVHVYRGVTPNSRQLLDLFAQADIFVFPTRADCLPLAIMEALASGLPIITTCVGALPEAVTHGETGWIVPPDDPGSLADAIALLAAEPEMRAQLGVQARAVALKRFDAVTNYNRLIEVVKSVAR